MKESPIVITLERACANEAAAITELCTIADFRLHIRKDHEAMDALLLNLVDMVDLKRVSVHHDYALARKYGVGGFHTQLDGFDGVDKKFVKSAPCHTLQEVESAEGFDYLFLSPIFDSISKENYKSSFDIDTLVLPKDRRVVALGGICAETVKEVRGKGFSTVALLGSLWKMKSDGVIDIDKTIDSYMSINRLWKEI